MAALNMNVIGITAAKGMLISKSTGVYKNANEAIKKAGFFIEGEVKESIAGKRAEHRSVDTGRFLGSVKNVQNKPLTATIESNVEYANALEYGTRSRAPRSHFRNTKVRNETIVKEFIESEIKKS